MGLFDFLFQGNKVYDVEILKISELLNYRVGGHGLKFKTTAAIEATKILKECDKNMESVNGRYVGMSEMQAIDLLSKYPSEFLTAIILELNKSEDIIGMHILDRILMLIDNYLDVNANCQFAGKIDKEVVKMFDNIKDLQQKMIGVLVSFVFMGQQKFSESRKIYKKYRLSKKTAPVVIEEITKLSSPEFARELPR